MDAIATDALTKRYGERIALQHVSLRVPAGGLFGFLGPNGAGKTTFIRLLLGLLRPTSGEARVFGKEVGAHGLRIRAEVGYLPGDVRFYDTLHGRTTLRFLDAARGRDSREEIERLARRLELDLDRRVRTYSRGMKQKLGLIQAMMHRPRLLILDEPTTALDPLVREVLYEELRRVAAEGRTVLFSSHTLSEVEQLCDEIAILRAGRLVEQDRIDSLRQRAVRRVVVTFHGPATDPPAAFRTLQRHERRLIGTWSGPPAELLAWLSANPVGEVSVAPPDLESLFLEYYNNGATPERAA